MSELKNKIEAILFASGKGVSEQDLANYCESTPRKVLNQLKNLQEEFLKRDGSLIISKNQDKWKLTVRSKYVEDIQHIASETELSGPVLKTLAVIAFKSPVLQAEIINIRGQSAYEHIKRLFKDKLITKEEEGRSYILKITDKFYNYFDVKGDEEIREVFESLRKQQQKITELEIIEVAKRQEEQEKKAEQELLGNLTIIPIESRTKERTEEDKKEEETFLSNIDDRLNSLGKRVEEQELPKRVNEEDNENTTFNNEETDDKEREKEGKKNDDEKTQNQEQETSEKDIHQEETHEEKQTTKKQENNSKENYLDEIEQFAEEKKQKDEEENKETFL